MMKRPFFYLILLLVILSLIPPALMARSGWVSDTLVLTFREGPGNNYNVIKTLVSNTAVTILEEQDGFYKVELQNSETGWVDKKFILFDPPNAILLEKTRAENQALKDQIEKLETRLDERDQELTSTESQYSNQIAPLKKSLEDLTARNNTLARELEEATQKYNTLIEQSKNIQDIIQENKILKEDNGKLNAEVKELTDKNRNIFKTAMIKWFLAGVAVLLGGWLMGRSVSSRKKSYGSLLD